MTEHKDTTPQSSTPPRILVTGASGFIGSFIVEEALQRGMEVWAAVRKTSSRKYLQDPRIHFIELDLSHQEILTRQLEEHTQRYGSFHYIVHAAGATKCKSRQDFFNVNTEGTAHLAHALRTTQSPETRMVFISSLSVSGPLHEKDYTAISENETPHPNTAYGQSKLKAEEELAKSGIDYVVLRPTGVYGPREKDYFLMAKSIKQHMDFSVGYRRQIITFIYVLDLVQAVFLAMEKGRKGTVYQLSDGREYNSRDFSHLLQKSLGVRRVLHIKAPLWLLRSICAIAGTWASLTGSTSTLNGDKYRIMKQRNWKCDISRAKEELGFHPHYSLASGVTESISWYKKERWI